MTGKDEARSRREKIEAAKAAERKAERRSQFLIYGSGALVVLLIAVVVGIAATSGDDDSDAQTSNSGPKASAAPSGTVDYTTNSDDAWGGISHDHVTTPVTYPQTPPVGGDHDGTWLNCGVYDVQVHNENAVHSLEHGAVWITYQPDLPDDQVDAIHDAVKGYDFVVVSPYDGLPSPVVASAWGHQLTLDSADDPRLAEFLSYFVQGPQTPEPGASCSGGTMP